MNSIEATTTMEDLTRQKNKVLSEAAKTIATYVTTEAVGDVHKQVMQMCAGFAPDETVRILAMALEYVAKKGGSQKPPKQKSRQSSGSFTGAGRSDSRSLFGSGSSYGGFTGR